MKLSQEDVELFYKLYHSLQFYVNQKLKVADDIKSPEELFKCTIEQIKKLREGLYENPKVIDSFIAENPMNFTPDELKVIGSWKDSVKDELLVWRYLKNYTIFLDINEPPKAYGVVALNSSFEEMIGSDLPVMVDAVLLPFKNRIVYDGILPYYQVHFGGGMRRNFNDSYQEAKFRYGIITSLPLPKEQEKNDADVLRFYLKSESNREIYEEEIDRLINEDRELLKIYHQETGKVHARRYRRQLRKIGVNKGWFAILEGLIIASGATKEELETVLKGILPSEKQDFVFVFQMESNGITQLSE